MNLQHAIRMRRAVRDYRADPIAPDAIHQLISAASWAPSAMNEQPWYFTVVTDTALLDEISTRAKASLLATMDSQSRADHFRDIMADPQFHLFYHAPALVVIATRAAGEWAREDGALAAQNLMLAAVSLGLGTCWVGFAQAWLNSAAGKELLNLPADALVVAPITLGHPKAIPPTVPRKSPTVSWIGNQADAIASHPATALRNSSSSSNTSPA